MTRSSSFIEALLEPRPESEVGPAASKALEAKLDEIWVEARKRWPAVVIGQQEFMTYLGQHALRDAPLVKGLARLHTSDLYLACACASHDRAALAAFETHCIAPLDVVLVEVRGAAGLVDEVKQELRSRFLVATPPAAPRITQYAGQGPLKAWVKVAAVRETLSLLGRGKRKVGRSDDRLVEDLPDHDADQELAYLKMLYQREFKESFIEALALLDSRERNLVRYRHLDELNIDQIGSIYGVHRATAARWLSAARGRLLEETRRALRERLEIGDDEFESIMRLIQSQLDVSISRHLRSRDEA